MAEEKEKQTEQEVEVSSVENLVSMLDTDEKKSAVAELINRIGKETASQKTPNQNNTNI